MPHDRRPGQQIIVAIVQARMSSTRLPGKVLAPIEGRPMLAHIIERARRAKTLDDVIVATTTDAADDQVATLCREQSFSLYRGSAEDVLDRYYRAAVDAGADVIVRITGDCPLHDPNVIDYTVSEFLRSGVDFAANRLPPPWKRTYPIGLDTEVCTMEALETAWGEADQPYQRVHVMPYLYEEPGRFRVLLVHHKTDLGHLRWTVDTPEDLEVVREIYSRFSGRNDFSWHEVLALFEQEPALAEINRGVQHKRHGEL